MSRPLHLAAIIPVCLAISSCRSSSADQITQVLNICASVSAKARTIAQPGDQARYLATEFQRIDTTHCPQDFRIAFQAHVNAWNLGASAIEDNTTGAALVEGFLAGFTGDNTYLGRSGQSAATATREINRTYSNLTQIAASYGARIPQSNL